MKDSGVIIDCKLKFQDHIKEKKHGYWVSKCCRQWTRLPPPHNLHYLY